MGKETPLTHQTAFGEQGPHLNRFMWDFFTSGQLEQTRSKKKKKLAGNAAERLSGVMRSDFPGSCSEMQQDKRGGGENERCS